MKKNILIIGAGVAGKLLQKDIRQNHAQIELIGFVDDKNRSNNKIIGGIDDLPKLVRKYRVEEIVIAIPSADGSLIRKILDKNMDNQIPVLIVPREQKVIKDNEVLYNSVRSLRCDDWLGRPPVKRNIKNVESNFKNKTVLVTGGAGSIGSEVVRQLLGLGVKKVIILDNSEHQVYRLEQELKQMAVKPSKYRLIIGNIMDKPKIFRLLKKHKPDIVFHAAAYKHVHLMERNIDEAVKTNVIGTKNVADAAINAEVNKFVFISTDKTVNPASVMGASKKIAELYIQSLRQSNTTFSIVRFGNIINSHGSVLPMFERQLQTAQEITVTDPEMKRYFMSIREAAQLVILSATRMTSGAIYVLDMGDLISMGEVARCTIRSHNLRPEQDVKIRIIGRRPGEKMIEEIFTDKEKAMVEKTNMPHVSRLRNNKTDKKSGDKIIKEITPMIDNNYSDHKILKYLRTVFPSLN